MSHEVERMMYAGATPWHGLGHQVDSNLPWHDAIIQAGLDWQVAMMPVSVNGSEVDGFKAVMRTTDGAVYTVVTDRYQPIQNHDAFKLFGELFGDAAVLNTAGALRGGKIVWGLAEMPDTFDVAGDTHKKYLLVTTRHDGTGSLRAFPTCVRVVCNNTLNLAFRSGTDGGIAVRHSGSIEDKMRVQAGVLGKSLHLFAQYEHNLQTLLADVIDRTDSEQLVHKLLNAETTRGQNAISAILASAAAEDTAGTGYALWQGITDYADHAGNWKAERRMDSMCFGARAAMKTEAMHLLLQHAGSPSVSINDLIAATAQ